MPYTEKDRQRDERTHAGMIRLTTLVEEKLGPEIEDLQSRTRVLEKGHMKILGVGAVLTFLSGLAGYITAWFKDI